MPMPTLAVARWAYAANTAVLSCSLFRLAQIPEPTKDDDVAITLAPSWVEKLSLEPRDYQTRCPHGHRTIQLESSVVDIYAEYLREDGLVKQCVGPLPPAS